MGNSSKKETREQRMEKAKAEIRAGVKTLVIRAEAWDTMEQAFSAVLVSLAEETVTADKLAILEINKNEVVGGIADLSNVPGAWSKEIAQARKLHREATGRGVQKDEFLLAILEEESGTLTLGIANEPSLAIAVTLLRCIEAMLHKQAQSLLHTETGDIAKRAGFTRSEVIQQMFSEDMGSALTQLLSNSDSQLH